MTWKGAYAAAKDGVKFGYVPFITPSPKKKRVSDVRKGLTVTKILAWIFCIPTFFKSMIVLQQHLGKLRYHKLKHAKMINMINIPLKRRKYSNSCMFETLSQKPLQNSQFWEYLKPPSLFSLRLGGTREKYARNHGSTKLIFTI